MKRVYVVEVRWYEDGIWMHTSLYAFSNRKAAQSYANWKKEHRTESANTDNSEYTIEELTVWDKSPMEID